MFFKTKNNLLRIKEKYWEEEKAYLLRKRKLNEDKYNFKQKKKSKPAVSKLLIAFLFLNCSAIEIFTCWSIWKMLYISMINGTTIDFTPLVALISTVVAEVIGYGIYSLKAMKENTAGGIVYDAALNNEKGVG